MNGHVEGIKATAAGTIGAAAAASGVAWEQHLLALGGIVVVILTAIERYHSINLRRTERKIKDAELDQITRR